LGYHGNGCSKSFPAIAAENAIRAGRPSASPPVRAPEEIHSDPIFPNVTIFPVQTSGRAFPVVSFVYFSVERPFNKFYGINRRPKLGAKLIDRFFHGRRQVSPPINNLSHRFLDGPKHFLDCNFTVGSRHSFVASLFARCAARSNVGGSAYRAEANGASDQTAFPPTSVRSDLIVWI